MPLKTQMILSKVTNDRVDSFHGKILVINALNEFYISPNIIIRCCPLHEKTGDLLKNDFSRLFYVTCISHLYHNAIMKLLGHFQKVNSLIASVKSSIVKNKTRQSLFYEIGLSTETIITRWGG